MNKFLYLGTGNAGYGTWWRMFVVPIKSGTLIVGLVHGGWGLWLGVLVVFWCIIRCDALRRGMGHWLVGLSVMVWGWDGGVEALRRVLEAYMAGTVY